jgi:hypothetical protein
MNTPTPVMVAAEALMSKIERLPGFKTPMVEGFLGREIINLRQAIAREKTPS